MTAMPKEAPQERIDNPKTVLYTLLALEISILIGAAIVSGVDFARTHNSIDFVEGMATRFLPAGAFVFVIVGALYLRARKLQRDKAAE